MAASHSIPQVVEKVQIKTTGINESAHAKLLISHSLSYHVNGYYLQVGDIKDTRGWMLHVSAVLSQINKLIELVVPYLATQRVPFKMIFDENLADDLLSGDLGINNIGKIICIYPPNERDSLAIAKDLINLTSSIKGPLIPTDFCLGNVIYTRYGSFSPINKLDENGIEKKYMYSQSGELIEDIEDIPFQFPKEVFWPFYEISEPNLPPAPKFENRLYKALEILKPDPRGNVYKGLYVKNLFNVKKCVLKQGHKNYTSDFAGRDILDRLKWQFELYKKLSHNIPLARIYDIIEEDKFSVLIMQFVNGVSLYTKIQEINHTSTVWSNFTSIDSLKIINYAIQIADIISKLHSLGFYHRDIVPVNFLITKTDKIILIDLELAYSYISETPNPPFSLGTFGFMSPEQESRELPTAFQDIYSLGATLLFLFTGLTPVKFDINRTQHFADQLNFFIGNKSISALIANCMNRTPTQRPKIENIRNSLRHFQKEIKAQSSSEKNPKYINLDHDKLIMLIDDAIWGLTKAPVVSNAKLWYSKRITKNNATAIKIKEYTKLIGLAEGLSGPLYVLARVKKGNISTDPCNEFVTEAWNYIQTKQLPKLAEIPHGLYKGSYGLAITIAENIRCGILENNPSILDHLKQCLSKVTNNSNLATGWAGQGIAIIRCSDLIGQQTTSELLNKVINNLEVDIRRITKLGSLSIKLGVEKLPIFDIAFDDSGILLFLLEYLSYYPDTLMQNKVSDLFERTVKDNSYMKHFYETVGSRNSYEYGDGGKGFILALIKAYKVLKSDNCKKATEGALQRYPDIIANSNFTQYNGLAGIGEIYLEAWKAFKAECWKSRADWVANLYLNTYIKSNNAYGFWKLDEYNPPTADLLTGVSGIIHFLSRMLKPEIIGYRLLY